MFRESRQPKICVRIVYEIYIWQADDDFYYRFVSISFASAQTERENGNESYEKGDYQAAAEFLQKATQTNEKDRESWRFLGMAYARIKNVKQSRKAFEKADDFNDKDLNAAYDKPVKIISKRPPQYTEEARRNQVSGRKAAECRKESNRC